MAAPSPAAGTPAPGPVLGAGAPTSPAPAPAAGPAPAPAPAGPFGIIPEKFQVKAADGSPDLAASWAKVEQARANLERRLGAGDAPPETVDGYKVNVPEKLADRIKVEELSKDPGFKEFLGTLHAAKAPQSVVDAAVAAMLTRGMELRAGMNQLSADDCVAALKGDWKTEAEYSTQLGAAYRAASTYGDVDKLMQKYGNDPDFIRVMAKVGAELSEDTGTPNGGQTVSEADVDALQKSKAYWDEKDPAHAQTKAKVTAFFEKKHGTGARASGSLAFTTALR